MTTYRIDIIASSNIYICNRTKTEEQRRNGSCKETNYHKPILGTFQGRQAKSDRACCRIELKRERVDRLGGSKLIARVCIVLSIRNANIDFGMKDDLFPIFIINDKNRE